MFLTSLFTLTIVLSGCLQEGDGSSSKNTSPTTSPSGPTVVDLGFSGISKVQDMDANSIKVSWNAATSSNVIGYRVYEIAADGTPTAIQQVDSTKTSFIHTGLVFGSTHSYLVKAIDFNGNYDGNMVVKSIFTYSGISSVTITGLNSATVYFSPSSSSTAGANIYYKAVRGGDWVLAGTVSNSESSFNITGLRSGTKYQFRIFAFDGSSIEEANPQVQLGRTPSYSYDPPTPLAARYQGFILARAFGAAPGAAVDPKTRQVTLVWASFYPETTTTSASYSLVRVAKGGSLDMTVTTPCTLSTATSCQVCTITGAGNQSCTDTNVAAPPAAYDYAVSLMPTSNWAEEMPTGTDDSIWRTTVQIPPDNMVLVHRDSVNYEMCTLMGKTPRPLEKQRCEITGASMVGAIPYNTFPGASPLNMSTGYYDFGYNLFVDRWQAACNWTPASTTGMCGAGATSGDCYGNTDPSNTIGVPGNVYYRTDGATCWVKKSDNTWTNSNSTLTTDQRSLLVTTDPQAQGGYRPPLAVINQANSALTCGTMVDPYYGAKRLLRKREFVAAAAWPTTQGEPNAMSDTDIGTIEAGATVGAHTSLYQCNSSSHYGITAGAFKSTKLAGDAGDAVRSFVIGSLETSKCVSRFGTQDMVGNVWEWNSDQAYCNNTNTPISTPYSLNAYTCIGTASTVDSGNGYSSGFDMNGFKFDGTQGPGGTAVTDWYIQDGSNGASYFNVALGLPMVGNDNGNSIAVAANTAKFHNDRFYLTIANTTSRGLCSGGAWGSGTNNGRWASFWYYAPTSTNTTLGFRCALPAE